MTEYWVDPENPRILRSGPKPQLSPEERLQREMQRDLEDGKARRRKEARNTFAIIAYLVLQAWLVTVTFPLFLPAGGLTNATTMQGLVSIGFGLAVMGFVHWLATNAFRE